MTTFKYITADSQILGGKPIIKGTRISVELILEWLTTGTVDEIVKSYPHLSKEAVNEAILYAAQSLKNEIVIETAKA